MARILFVSELGGGFGHVRRLLPIADVATCEGADVTVLAANAHEVKSALGSRTFDVRPCPSVAHPSRLRSAPVASSFADILGNSGFDDVEFLSTATSSWISVFDELRPAAIVCEFSPIVSLAAHCSDVPLLSTGYGFVLPPPHLEHFPRFRSATPEFGEQRLLDNVRAVARLHGRSFASSLPSLFAGSAHEVTGLDLLDTYRAQRTRPALGPPGLVFASADETPRNDFFAYLLGDAACTSVMLEALVVSGLAGRVFLRRAAEKHRQLLDNSRVELLTRPAQLAEELGHCRWIIHHASMLTTEEALIAGRPQLVLPLYLEHLLTARRLLELGVARVLKASTSVEAALEVLHTMHTDDNSSRGARAVSMDLRATEHARRESPKRLWHTVKSWFA